MVDKHNKSFFGQSTGMFLQSSSKTDPFLFLRFIKKKESGTWEKPSIGGGKTFKDFNTFIEFIAEEPEIPFMKEEIKDFIGRYNSIDFNNDLEEKAIEIYKFICVFFDNLQIYLNREEKKNGTD